MAATKTNKAKTTKPATKVPEGNASEKDNAPVHDATEVKNTAQGEENNQVQDTAGNEQASPADNGGDNGDTQDPQAKPEGSAGKEKDNPPPAQESTKRIAVKSMTPSFRRAGFEFSRTERILDVRRLTDEQLQAIQEEPRLVVRPVGQED
jgi:hypothetical protein